MLLYGQIILRTKVCQSLVDEIVKSIFSKILEGKQDLDICSNHLPGYLPAVYTMDVGSGGTGGTGAHAPTF